MTATTMPRDPLDIVIATLAEAHAWSRYAGDDHLTTLITLARGEALLLKDKAERAAAGAAGGEGV